MLICDWQSSLAFLSASSFVLPVPVPIMSAAKSVPASMRHVIMVNVFLKTLVTSPPFLYCQIMMIFMDRLSSYSKWVYDMIPVSPIPMIMFMKFWFTNRSW